MRPFEATVTMSKKTPAPVSNPPLVIQAYFSGGRPPASLVTSTYRSPYRPALPAHAATVQTKSASGLPPHAATVQTKNVSGLPPHAATVGGKTPRASSTLPVPAVQRSPLGDDVHAFRTPQGLLDGTSGSKALELPPTVRRKMETFFETDLTDVRVRVGNEASSIGAIAFTLGSDLYFAPGHYDPHTPRGQELLGHELTHVLQQRDGRVANPFGDGTAVVQDPALEEEADRMGRLIAAQAQVRTSYRRELNKNGLQAKPRGRETKSAQRHGGKQRLVIGAYMHEGGEKLPEPLAGHAFVALEDGQGHREAYGFSPAHYGDYDPQRDLSKLSSGVEGVVHDDTNAFEKPGVKTHVYTIDEAQAQAARDMIEEYQSGKRRFSLKGSQCTAFAADVAKAADVDEAAGLRGKLPRDVYRKL